MRSDQEQPLKAHVHVAGHVHVVLQRGGVPYEVDRTVCAECGAVIEETPVKRTDA